MTDANEMQREKPCEISGTADAPEMQCVPSSLIKMHLTLSVCPLSLPALSPDLGSHMLLKKERVRLDERNVRDTRTGVFETSEERTKRCTSHKHESFTDACGQRAGRQMRRFDDRDEHFCHTQLKNMDKKSACDIWTRNKR